MRRRRRRDPAPAPGPWQKLEAIPSLARVLTDIEMPLVRRCWRGSSATARWSTPTCWASRAANWREKMVVLERQAYDLAGQEFNLGSPGQLGRSLHDKLGLPVLSKTATGQPSTVEAVLAELAEQDFELPKVIMQYRSMSKPKSTYTDRLPEQINPRTGRIHTSYHQAVAATGRLSSSDPNLQNIPIRTAEGRRIRLAFVAPQGYKPLVSRTTPADRAADHGPTWPRDDGLLDAFRHDLDVHRATAAEVFGVPLEDVSGDQRRSAKAINFWIDLRHERLRPGIADRRRAQGGPGLHRPLLRPLPRRPGVHGTDPRPGRGAGFVETLFGRRLYLPEIHSKNGAMRKAAERTAINAPMQAPRRTS